MSSIRNTLAISLMGAACLVPALSHAQEYQRPVNTTPATNTPEDTDSYEVQPGDTREDTRTYQAFGEGAPPQNLPAPQSDSDPQPIPAAPSVPEEGITEQAGVGGTQAYGRAGVLELGGNMGFARASEFTQFNVSPSIGWFFMDNLEISGIVGVNYIDTGADDTAYMTLLAEPSFHLPFSREAFGFIGVGTGLSYAEDPGIGFALAPRIGMNVMVGRSGVLTPALQMVYSTSEAVQTPQGTLVAVNASFGANVGYTVMW